MPITYEESLQNPAARRQVFVQMDMKSNMVKWVNLPGINPAVTKLFTCTMPGFNIVGVNWYNEAAETVIALTERLSQADLESNRNAGGFWWDEDAEEVSVTLPFTSGDPLTDPQVYGELVFADIQVRASRDADILNDSQYLEAVSQLPSLNLRTSELFEGKRGQVGGGSVSYKNTVDSPGGLAFWARKDFEPDGTKKIVARNKTFGAEESSGLYFGFSEDVDAGGFGDGVPFADV